MVSETNEKKKLNKKFLVWCQISNFGPFLDLQEFFKNRGLSFQTSNSDFRDQLDELFHMVNKISKKRSKLQVLFHVRKGSGVLVIKHTFEGSEAFSNLRSS